MLPVGPGDRPTDHRTDADWRWWRPVLTSADGEHLAADHMRHLGFCGVFVRPGAPDDGTVWAIDAAATVRTSLEPEDRPLACETPGSRSTPASSYLHRLVYTACCSEQAIRVAELQGVALFRFRSDGAVHAITESARSLVAERYTPPPRRAWWGRLTPFGRQVRGMVWLQQLASAGSGGADSGRHARSDDDRMHDSSALIDALSSLRGARDPDMSRRDRASSLRRAESALRSGAHAQGVRLRQV